MCHAGVSGLTTGLLSSCLSSASYLLTRRLNQLKFNNKKMKNKSNPQNRQHINSHARGCFYCFVPNYAYIRINAIFSFAQKRASRAFLDFSVYLLDRTQKRIYVARHAKWRLFQVGTLGAKNGILKKSTIFVTPRK